MRFQRKLAMPVMALALSAFPFFNAHAQHSASAKPRAPPSEMPCTITVSFKDIASVAYSNDTLHVNFKGGNKYVDTRMCGRLYGKCPKIGVYSKVLDYYQVLFIAVVDNAKQSRNVHTLGYVIDLLNPRKITMSGVALGDSPALPPEINQTSFVWDSK